MLVAGIGCAVVSAQPTPPGWDGAVAEGGSGSSGGSSGGFTGLDANACQPASVATYMPGPYHAPSPYQGVCNPSGGIDPVTRFYDVCLGKNADSMTCAAFEQANAACVACILTPDSAKAYGPLLDHGGFVTANIAGCLERSDPAMLMCAKAVQVLSGCELAACEANCAVHDSASLMGYDACVMEAENGGCKGFASGATCAITAPDASPDTARCLADFATFYKEVVPLFCGPTEADAGAADARPSSFDAGLFDASFDASSDAWSDAWSD
jgi:hypothetical protein